MSVNLNEYRFKTLGARGHIVLTETEVTCDTTSYLGRWKTSTPYSAIEPHPILLWQTPPFAIYCGFGLGFLAFFLGFAAVAELRTNNWLPTWVFAFYAGFCAVTFGLLVRVMRNWTAEWIMFPTSIDGHRIAYVKTRGNNKMFEDFTDNLTNRIASATKASDVGL